MLNQQILIESKIWYNIPMVRQLFSWASLLLSTRGFASTPPSQTQGGVNLIQTLGTSSSIPADSNALFLYISDGLGWLHKVAVGLVILWLIIAGVMIMISGNDQGKRTEAKEHAVAAIIGLVMLFLLGFILSVLNANFFIQ